MASKNQKGGHNTKDSDSQTRASTKTASGNKQTTSQGSGSKQSGAKGSGSSATKGSKS